MKIYESEFDKFSTSLLISNIHFEKYRNLSHVYVLVSNVRIWTMYKLPSISSPFLLAFLGRIHRQLFLAAVAPAVTAADLLTTVPHKLLIIFSEDIFILSTILTLKTLTCQKQHYFTWLRKQKNPTKICIGSSPPFCEAYILCFPNDLGKVRFGWGIYVVPWMLLHLFDHSKFHFSQGNC